MMKIIIVMPVVLNENENDINRDSLSPINKNDIKINIRNIIIGQCQHINLNNDSIDDIFKITIYLSCQKEDPIQTKIYFEKSCNSIYDYELISRHIYYNNYIKIVLNLFQILLRFLVIYMIY